MNGSWARPVSVPQPGAVLALPLVAAASLGAGWLLVEGNMGARGIAAATIAVLLVGLGLAVPDQMLLILVVWLVSLGFVRRLMPGGFETDVDPLLAVAPVGYAALVVVAGARGAFRIRTPLATTVVAFGVLAVLSALNPLQGSLLAGFGGLFFVVVPMLAFWIGRTLGDDALRTVFLLISVLAIVTSIYGLAQVVRGFPPWDVQWIERSDFAALEIFTAEGFATRPFASFSSGHEYAYFIAIGLLILLVWGAKRRQFLVLAPIALLVVALVYASSRMVVVALVAALALTLAAAWRLRFATAVLITAGALLALPLLLGAVAPSFGQIPSAPLITHQLQGLQDPLNADVSTLRTHLTLMKRGFAAALDQPAGLGIGVTNIAGQRFAASTSLRTEADPSNVAAALGIPGLALYVVLVVLAFLLTYRHAALHRDLLSLVALGIIALTFLHWLNGGQYAVAFLPWLVLGWVDQRSTRERSVNRHASREQESFGVGRPGAPG